MLKYLVTLAFAMISLTAMASDQSGRVYSLHVRETDGLVWVVLEGTNRTPKPACARGNYFVIKTENSSAGRQQLSLLLTAKASGRTIVINGSGSCTRWADGEDIVIVAIAD
jgi:hypothetical protein